MSDSETDLENRLFAAYLGAPDGVLVFTLAFLSSWLDLFHLA